MIAAARQTKSDITWLRGYKSKYLAATHFKSGMFSVTTLQNRLKKNFLWPKTFPKRLEWSYLGRAQTASALQRAESVHSCKSTLTWGGRSA